MIINGMTRFLSIAMIAMIAMCCTGCASFLPQRSQPDHGDLPESYSLTETTTARDNLWWQDFGSPELNAIIDEALAENLSLRQLWARLDQADATTIRAASGLYPQLNFSSNAGYGYNVSTVETQAAPSLKSQVGQAVAGSVAQGLVNGLTGGTASTGIGSQNTRTVEQSVTREPKQFGLGLAASYELDIWGRIDSEYKASQFDYAATRDDLEAVAITLTAEIVDRWLRINEMQALKLVLLDQLETNTTYLELVELRFRKARVSALDVYQQRQTVSEVKKQIPLVEAREQVLRHELAVLLGKPPMTSFEVGDYDLEQVPTLPAVGVPSDLLVNRPDIRAALADLYAADHRVASARADRLPAIRLTGGVGYDAGDIAHLFDDWFLNLAAGLTAPLLDGGQREAEVARRLAVVEERLTTYRLTVLNAIKEVEDALVNERKHREYINSLSEQLEDASNALREAGNRYRKGISDYLPVLSALERTQSLTRSLIIARRELLVFRVNLYRALGGTWTTELEQPTRLSEDNPLAQGRE